MLAIPTNSTKEVYDLAEVLLHELWDHQTALRLVGVGLTQFACLDARLGETVQPSLFGREYDRRLELEKRIDQLRNRYGHNSIIPASLLYLSH